MTLGTGSPSRIVCAGCGAVVDPDAPLPFACPRAALGDDIDHGLMFTVEGDADALAAAAALESQGRAEIDGAPEDDARADAVCPFLRFRACLPSHGLALRQGMDDAEYCAIVRDLDRAVAAVDGRGFTITPYRRSPALGLWFKDETVGVAGSHKARHLMGVAIHLAVVERLGLAALAGRDLAIASCGNAALAAAVVARAARRRLRVFVPPTANPAVLRRLAALEAEIVLCARTPADPPGDPCVHRFREAVAAGAIPFSCQGPDDALTIQGGLTLAFELALQHARSGAPALGRLFVQVGGGALASALIQGLRIAVRAGILPALPRIHAVQTARAHPLARAVGSVRALATAIDRSASSSLSRSSIAATMAHARSHRAAFMRPWPEEPQSVAGGILDDETYDWAVITEAILETEGSVVLADEAALVHARDRVEQELGVIADATGTAGIAGVLTLRASGALAADETLAALITGARR